MTHGNPNQVIAILEALTWAMDTGTRTVNRSLEGSH
jgi:hypothetical protein